MQHAGIVEEKRKKSFSSMLFSTTATAVSTIKECLKQQSSINSKCVIVSLLSKLVPYQHHLSFPLQQWISGVGRDGNIIEGGRFYRDGLILEKDAL